MKKNLIYAAPAVEFIMCAAEGVLCQSGRIEGWKEEQLSRTVSEAAIEIPSVEL